MRLLFDPVGRGPKWLPRLLWLLPLLPLLWETDLTALLWLGSTALILLLSRDARQAVFQMIYIDWVRSVLLGIVFGTVIGLGLNPLIDGASEYVTGTQIDLSQFADVHEDAGGYIELLLVAIIFGGVIEEVCFRGFFVGWGIRLFGNRFAAPLVILSSLAFAIGHLYQSAAGGLSTGIFALIMGALYLFLDRKLLPIILTHAVSNFWGVTDIYLNGI